MSSDIDVLIDFYQWEKQRLLLSIEENKRDQDYIAVDNNYKELRYVQRELDALSELKNPNYPKIKRLEWQIELYSKHNHHHSELSDLNSQMVNHYKEELEKIKKEKFPSPTEETQFIDDALFSMANNRSKGFVLHLDLKMDTCIDLSAQGENQILLSLKVENKRDAKNLKKYTLLGDLGLTYDTSSNCLVRVFEVGPNKDVLPIKEAISRIVIGSKGFLWGDGMIYLKPKP